MFLKISTTSEDRLPAHNGPTSMYFQENIKKLKKIHLSSNQPIKDFERGNVFSGPCRLKMRLNEEIKDKRENLFLFCLLFQQKKEGACQFEFNRIKNIYRSSCCRIWPCSYSCWMKWNAANIMRAKDNNNKRNRSHKRFAFTNLKLF